MDYLSLLCFLWPTETLIKDIRFGVRSLLRRPGFTARAIITLALGIGASRGTKVDLLITLKAE
jgi:hypothetical protein